MDIYVVKSGDTIESIAKQFGVTVQRIISDNELKAGQPLVVGQTIVILYPDRVYTVKNGDSLSAIAQLYGVTTRTLLANNPVLNGIPMIYPGQTIVISYKGEKVGSMMVNGYTYPFIEEKTLRKTLPYLTYLTVFTYGFTESGELIEPDDQEIITIASSYSVAPIMLISTLTEDGTFNNELSKKLFADQEAQNNLINNIIANMKKKGYYGLDIDFEFVFKEDAPLYVEFVNKVSRRLKREGFILVISLAPKTSVDQPGLLYEGHNYEELGEAADMVLLMTYEWGFAFGPPMAVSPINEVRKVLSFAVTQIRPDKILEGVPNYGYDWKLPFVRGESMAEALSNVEAVALAARVGAEIQYDEESQAPFFTYTEEGAEHIVWFDDARSIKAKLSLVPEFGILGASYWTVMKYFPQNWLVLNSLYDIVTVV